MSAAFKMRESKKVSSVLENASGLKGLSQKLSVLDELNRILHKFLPKHLVKHCHIGAVDTDKNLVILYLADSSLQHIITNMANAILDNFHSHHYSFAGLITRIRPKSETNQVRLKTLDPKVKDKLEQLAQSINRSDLIEIKNIIEDKKEIDF